VPSDILPRIPVSTRPSGEVTCLGVGCVLVREGSLSLCLHALNLRLQIQIRCRFMLASLPRDSIAKHAAPATLASGVCRRSPCRFASLSPRLRLPASLSNSGVCRRSLCRFAHLFSSCFCGSHLEAPPRRSSRRPRSLRRSLRRSAAHDAAVRCLATRNSRRHHSLGAWQLAPPPLGA
jgi:hypothetical protein